jgi:glyoxylase-like metal-dependent hydrolase (beta-lactamase superfamily II)
VEVVMFSHAHYDHYDGVYHLPQRDKFEVWTLDLVAPPIEEPFKLRAPFVDARPVRIDRKPKAGDVLAWREYRFHFHHLPGQSVYTMGVETTLPDANSPTGQRKCFFTADNFFHQDQFSGTGGWMGLNRSWPMMYAGSAQKVLDAAPEWVLAEHGGPFEFNAEDFKRRVQWGKECAKAADALCPSGNHLKDWNPHAIHVEPLLQKARPGAALKWTLTAWNPLPGKESLKVVLDGRKVIDNQTWQLDVPGGQTVKREFTFQVPAKLPAGRHVFALQTGDPSDAFLVVEVE